MVALRRLADHIDRLIALLGRLLILAVPLVVLLAAAVVVLRYAVGIGFPWLSESFVWLNGVIFTLGAPYLLQQNRHVRVEVLYGHLPARGQALVNLLGVVLLLWPSCYAVAAVAWPSVYRSLRALEASPTIDGLPFLYVLKLCVPLFCALTALQGVSLAVRALDALRARPADDLLEDRRNG